MQPREGYPDVDEQHNDFMPQLDDMFDVQPPKSTDIQAQMNTMMQVLNQLTENMAQMVWLTTMQVQNQMPQLA